MSASIAAIAANHAVRSPSPTEQTSLLGHTPFAAGATLERHPRVLGHPPEDTAHTGRMGHFAAFAAFNPTRHTADHHASRFWPLARPHAPEARAYRPSHADGVRLDGMLNGVQWSLICMGVAGLTDGVRHAGPTTLNPDASEHWLGGWGALVGALTLALAVAPTVTGHAYGAVLHGCTLANHQLEAHPIKTRMAGYAAALTGAALSLGAGTYLALQSKHEEAGRLPGTPAPYNAVYHQWGALALIGSSMGIASAGWYAGRLGAAAMYAIAGR